MQSELKCTSTELTHAANSDARTRGIDVRLSGWLRNRRDHGGVYFIDLADHYGITQLVVAPGSDDVRAASPPAERNRHPRRWQSGRARRGQRQSRRWPTGEIEVRVTDAEVAGHHRTAALQRFPRNPPFPKICA